MQNGDEVNKHGRFAGSALYGLAAAAVIIAITRLSPTILQWLVVALVCYLAGSGIVYSFCLFGCCCRRLMQRLTIVFGMIAAFAIILSGYPLVICDICTPGLRLLLSALTSGACIAAIAAYMMNFGMPTAFFPYYCMRSASVHSAIVTSFAKERWQRKLWNAARYRWLGVVVISLVVSASYTLLQLAVIAVEAQY